MSEKERLKDQPDEKETAGERGKATEPHPGRRELARYFDGTLDPESTAHFRVHLLDCRECEREVSFRKDLETLLDVDDPGAEELQTVEFRLSALPLRRKGEVPGGWWNDPKRAAAGPWLEQGPYRLALDRFSRNELSLCLRKGDRPLREVLAVFEPVGKPGTPELARGVTNEKGEARLRFRVMPPSPKGDYRVRVLVDSARISFRSSP
jgi:hypothetical protein